MFVLGSTLQNVAILPIFREETWASLLNRRNISFIFLPVIDLSCQVLVIYCINTAQKPQRC